jgi:hypothetical protein
VKTRQTLLLISSIILLSRTVQAAQDVGEGHYSCYAARGHAARYLRGYTIAVAPYQNQRQFIDECIATITDSTGRIVFQVHDHGVEIDPVTGSDLDGDGYPEAVLQGYSGGAHCCWTYWIVSLGKRPELRARIYNERGIQFVESKPEGVYILVTSDGRFDYFDNLSHSSSPFPKIYLQFVRGKLIDVSPHFWNDYEEEIRRWREQLLPGDIASFRSRYKDDPAAFEELKCKILEIVLAYLQGGKSTEARRALGEMWPKEDIPRIEKLIQSIRGPEFLDGKE